MSIENKVEDRGVDLATGETADVFQHQARLSQDHKTPIDVILVERAAEAEHGPGEADWSLHTQEGGNIFTWKTETGKHTYTIIKRLERDGRVVPYCTMAKPDPVKETVEVPQSDLTDPSEVISEIEQTPLPTPKKTRRTKKSQ